MKPPTKPTEIDDEVGLFDRFADAASHLVSRAPFFAFCALLVVIWAPSYFVLKDIDLWQLIINTATTIITFLLVALLQNSSYRSDLATQHKLNAVADALSELMCREEGMGDHVAELRAAVGLEQRETST